MAASDCWIIDLFDRTHDHKYVALEVQSDWFPTCEENRDIDAIKWNAKLKNLSW